MDNKWSFATLLYYRMKIQSDQPKGSFTFLSVIVTQ
nr:MAG TPA: hypothetical protein [Caudoviricetes sp.]